MFFIALDNPSVNIPYKQNQKEFLSKKEIIYLYNRFLDEILHHDNLAFICLSDFFKYYDKKDIIVEIDQHTYNDLFEMSEETKDLSKFKHIPMSSRIKKLPFLNTLKTVKIKIKKLEDIFSKGVKYVRFSDIYYSDSGIFYIGAATLDRIPGAKSKDVSSGWSYILKGIKCPSGQIIINKIMMQCNMEFILSLADCSC